MTTIMIKDENSEITRNVYDGDGEYSDNVTWVDIASVFFTMLQGLGFSFSDMSGYEMAYMLADNFDKHLDNKKTSKVKEE